MESDDDNNNNFDLMAFSLIHPLMERLIDARRARNNILADVAGAIRDVSDRQASTYTRTLGEEELASLTRIVFRSSNKDEYLNTECLIELRAFEDGETVVQLPCGHVYGEEPICRWFSERKAQCPTCRRDIPGVVTSSTRLTDGQIENIAQQWINTRVLLELVSVTLEENENLIDAVDLRRSIVQSMLNNLRH